MIGLVLAAGAGRRLAPETDTLPKALIDVGAVGSGVTGSILERTLSHFVNVGVVEAAVVVGYRAEAIDAIREDLEQAYGLELSLIHNDRALEWNNAYSLWCARDWFARDDTLLANGDTLHPITVEQTLLADCSDSGVVLALDSDKPLAQEEMKVEVVDGRVRSLHKAHDPAGATTAGEYIGVSLLRADAASALADALQATFERNPQLYYEDGYTEFIARGGAVSTADIGTGGATGRCIDWVEIDNHDDLARAKEIACRC